jgi:RNA polymerase sigma-70 factor (TIGR02960 family)
VRTWLYRIATNTCLTALENRTRRPLPADLVGPSQDADAPMVPNHEIPWLQPFPDIRLGDPADAAAAKAGLRLAFVAALQVLPARQRAILILREVLDWPAADVAAVLDTTVAAVNSGLQRARARLEAGRLVPDRVSEPTEAERRAALDRYVEAFERADVAALTRLLTEDVVLEMPPVLNWYVGRELYARFMDRVFTMRGNQWKAVPISANGQPGLAAYVPGDGGAFQAHSLQVLTIRGGTVAHNVVFADTALFTAFELPLRI